jgi:hypothetical protein
VIFLIVRGFFPISADSVRIEVSDKRFLDDLRGYLQVNGCPSEPRGDDRCEVRVLWPSEDLRSDMADRMKIFGHLREWCADHPGIHANILT